jgi:hypothetical protein
LSKAFDAEFEALRPTSQVIRGILTNAENTTINLMHPKDRAGTAPEAD